MANRSDLPFSKEALRASVMDEGLINAIAFATVPIIPLSALKLAANALKEYNGMVKHYKSSPPSDDEEQAIFVRIYETRATLAAAFEQMLDTAYEVLAAIHRVKEEYAETPEGKLDALRERFVPNAGIN